MDKLNKDELYMVATKLSLRDLYSFCMCNKRTRQTVLLKNDIWKYQLKMVKDKRVYYSIMIKLIMLHNLLKMKD